MAATELMTFDKVVMSVTDIARSAEWYGRVLGFERGLRTFIEPLQAEFQILRQPDIQIELLSRDGAVRNPGADAVAGPHFEKSGLTAIVLHTRDLEAATATLEQHQVDFVWKLHDLSADGLRSTMIRDPNGTLINIPSYPADVLVSMQQAHQA